MDAILRWGLGFTFAAPAAAPLIAQSVNQANVGNTAGAPMWTLVVLPLLAMLGNALGGVALEFMKGAIALWRAKVRARIRALGEDPDNPVINAPPEPIAPVGARETKPPSSG